MELYYKQEQLVKKPLVIRVTQFAGGLLLKELKYFEVMLSILEFLRV